jgi:hypothetical protein
MMVQVACSTTGWHSLGAASVPVVLTVGSVFLLLRQSLAIPLCDFAFEAVTPLRRDLREILLQRFKRADANKLAMATMFQRAWATPLSAVTLLGAPPLQWISNLYESDHFVHCLGTFALREVFVQKRFVRPTR